MEMVGWTSSTVVISRLILASGDAQLTISARYFEILTGLDNSRPEG